MPRLNTVRSFADQVMALKGEEEWETFLDVLISNSRDYQHGLKQELEYGVEPDREVEIGLMLKACKSHDQNILKLIQANRRS